MFKNIILTGFMGVGKSSVGTRLAADLNYSFVDIDSLVESDQRMSINAIFSKLGEPHFRDVEERIIRDVMGRESQVVSTGGGAVIREANRKAFKQSGFVICLTARPEVIFERIKHETHRPLLQTPDPLARIKELIASRAQFYVQADASIDTTDKSLDQVIAEIKERIKYAYC
jgi:shikimate kinase